MRATICLPAIIVLTCALGLGAQGATDFAGRWTTDPDPAASGGATGGAARGGAGRVGAGGATARGGAARGPGGARGGGRGRAGDMGSGWGPTITITQTAQQLTVEYAFFARGDMQPPLNFVYALDGAETTNAVTMGRGRQVQKSKTAWDGSTLVITTAHTFVDPATGRPGTTDVTQRLSLDSSTSLVVEATRAGTLGGPATTTRTVYRRLN
jgi:hypothetical protein